MGNMSLGAYTFEHNPTEIPGIIKPKKSTAVVDTYDDVAVFSWPASIKGKRVALAWRYMSTSQFDAIDALYQAGASVVFDPQDGSGKTYNVEILNVDADYFLYLEGAVGRYRQNAKLELLIISEVV